MDILSHLNSAPFRQFAEMVLDIYNPLALESTVPELGMTVATISSIEVWIGQAERRTWLPYPFGRIVGDSSK
jgi:hypothetical protein